MIRALISVVAAAAIANLSDPAWRVRERASACLYHLAPFVVPELLAAEQDRDVERSRRASFTLRLYYRDHADRLSRLLEGLPPISAYGAVVQRLLNWDEQQAGWHLMLCYRCQAYTVLGLDMPAADPWVLKDGHWRFTDPPGVQVEATRLMCRDWIAARRDVAPLLAALRGRE